MQIHTVSPSHKGKTKRRVGRGGKRGTYSGRGIKGQKSRAGAKIRPEIRDFIKRTPKLSGQGFSGGVSVKDFILNIKDLNNGFKGGGIINVKKLTAARLIPAKKTRVKILSSGEPSSAFKVFGIKVSKNAKAKIEKAGGSVNE